MYDSSLSPLRGVINKLIVIDIKTDESITLLNNEYSPKKGDIIEFNIGNKHIKGKIIFIRHSFYNSINSSIYKDTIIKVY